MGLLRVGSLPAAVPRGCSSPAAGRGHAPAPNVQNWLLTPAVPKISLKRKRGEKKKKIPSWCLDKHNLLNGLNLSRSRCLPHLRTLENWGTGLDAEIGAKAPFTHTLLVMLMPPHAVVLLIFFCCCCYTGCWFLISSTADILFYYLIILPLSLQTSVFP